MTTILRRFVHAPKGWRYGFPKALPDDSRFDHDFDMRAWMIEEGYPEEDVDSALQELTFSQVEIDV